MKISAHKPRGFEFECMPREGTPIKIVIQTSNNSQVYNIQDAEHKNIEVEYLFMGGALDSK